MVLNSEQYPVQRFIVAEERLRKHWTAFLVVGCFFLLINLLTSIWYLWFYWPMIHWGIGLAIHTAVVKINRRQFGPTPKGLAVHGAVQLILIAYFLSLDLITSFRLNWFIYPSIPLLIAWLIHYGMVKIYQPEGTPFAAMQPAYLMYNQLVIQEMTYIQTPISDTQKRGHAVRLVNTRIGYRIHLLFYLGINGFLFLINLAGGMWYPWFIWPALSWGVGLLMHYFAYREIVLKLKGFPPTAAYALFFPGTVCLFLFLIDLFSNGRLNWFWWPVAPIMLLSLGIIKGIEASRHPTGPTSVSHRENYIVYSNPNSTINEQEIAPSGEMAQERKFCPQCGKLVRPGHLFCQNCGLQLN